MGYGKRVEFSYHDNSRMSGCQIEKRVVERRVADEVTLGT